MPATPALKTDTSNGRVGRVTIANAYDISGPLGVSPTAQIAVQGSDDAFNEGISGTVEADQFPGRVVAVGLLPVDVSGNLTASDTWLVRQHGAGTLTMPANPWDGMRVGFMDADGAALAGSTLAVAPNAGQLIQNPYNASDIGNLAKPIRIPWQHVEWAWDAVGTNVNGGTNPCWRVVFDSAWGELPDYAATNANIALPGRGSVRASTTTSTVQITMTSSPTRGMRVRVKDVGGNSGANNITIAAAGAGWQIQPVNSTGAAPAASCVISNNHAGAEWEADTINKVWWAVCIL